MEAAEDLTIGLQEAALAAFEVEELAFVFEAAAEAGEAAIAADDSMARNDDGYGILSVGGTYSANCFGVADSIRQLAIRDRFAVRNLLEILPNALLKVCSFH